MRIPIILCTLFVCGLAATFEDASPSRIVVRDVSDEIENVDVSVARRSYGENPNPLCADKFDNLRFEKQGKNHTYCNSKWTKEEDDKGKGVLNFLKKNQMTYDKIITQANFYKNSVSSSDINDIVNKHNALRKDPRTTRTAKNMCKVYWDPEIAEIAQYFAEACPNGHDKNRNVPGYGFHIGQNLAWGHSNWVHAIQAWFDEVEDFVFGVGKRPRRSGESVKDYDDVQIGHYTQVLLATKKKKL